MRVVDRRRDRHAIPAARATGAAAPFPSARRAAGGWGKYASARAGWSTIGAKIAAPDQVLISWARAAFGGDRSGLRDRGTAACHLRDRAEQLGDGNRIRTWRRTSAIARAISAAATPAWLATSAAGAGAWRIGTGGRRNSARTATDRDGRACLLGCAARTALSRRGRVMGKPRNGRAAKWRMRKVDGSVRRDQPGSRGAAGELADVRRLPGSEVFREYTAICNWLGRSDGSSTSWTWRTTIARIGGRSVTGRWLRQPAGVDRSR